MSWREKIIRLTGECWHELKEKKDTAAVTVYLCTCGEFCYGEDEFLSHVARENTLAHVEDIKARLQKVPCRECGGSGIVGNKVPSSVDPAAFSPIKDCPTCKGKKHVDLWERFKSHVIYEIDACDCDFDDDISMLIGVEAVIEIMTEVEYCGPAAVSFLEERNG